MSDKIDTRFEIYRRIKRDSLEMVVIISIYAITSDLMYRVMYIGNFLFVPYNIAFAFRAEFKCLC